jgi:hypothetical protein
MAEPPVLFSTVIFACSSKAVALLTRLRGSKTRQCAAARSANVPSHPQNIILLSSDPATGTGGSTYSGQTLAVEESDAVLSV